jgi:hypothetical protein
VKFQSNVGFIGEATLTTGTIGTVVNVKLEEKTKNDTDKIRAAVSTAAIGTE